jgi:hypothetical protein
MSATATLWFALGWSLVAIGLMLFLIVTNARPLDYALVTLAWIAAGLALAFV